MLMTMATTVRYWVMRISHDPQKAFQVGPLVQLMTHATDRAEFAAMLHTRGAGA
jgi:hypothetical protein